MSRFEKPFTPDQDIVAHPYRGEAEHQLAADVVALCQVGASIIFGVRGLDGAPIAGLGLACRIVDNRQVRLLVLRKPNDDALMALTRDSRIAATFTRISDHRSIQLKGLDAVIGAVQPEDLRAATRQARAFRDMIIDLELGDAFAAAYCSYEPAELVAIQYTPDQAFTQTPGPGAGTRVAMDDARDDRSDA
ncbi:hypothetical protein DFR52_101427 [Hoeflea marina]|uniref:Pyridoxamine 5'-phosphate oxidase putative domain-containing protein n=1 Tax=Hoeflea marina TaxID=274592 RepID=A0A317PQI1_9HYPH|nr:hypothetical protein [Hoeflea marina]PWW03741.1 hypothetical protein DFR52_101427 [Hoeflea marina]